MTGDREHGSVGRLVCGYTVFALVHSASASDRAKRLAEALVGTRARDGLYRSGYVGLSVITTAGLLLWIARLPDRELYRVPRPWSPLFRLGQLAFAGLGLAGLKTAGPSEFAGLPSLRAYRNGLEPRAPMEAQGPLADPDGELRVTGPFRISRHPNNATALGGFLQPRMTVNRATLATLSCAYAVVGSLHEERRLRRRHGEAYDRYRAAVPFLLGPPRSATGARGRRAR